MERENKTVSRKNPDNSVQVIGNKFIADFGQDRFLLDFLSDSKLKIEVLQGTGNNRIVDMQRTLFRPDVYLVTWQENDHSTVTHLQDFAQEIVYSHVTMPDHTFYHHKGTLKRTLTETVTADTESEESIHQQNIDTVTRFLDLALNKNEVEEASQFVTERYTQHNPYVTDGRYGFMKDIKGSHDFFPQLRWKLKRVFVDGDYVVTHSEYEEGLVYTTVDIFKMKNGKIDEHVKRQIPSASESVNRHTLF